ncbi:MAG: NAD(P)/FAD-dependent oxidoreductase [Nitrospirae bacterium]|nr:NAD(P)/FAD-dependent oxidoreductase [Nitrospirota bacterium]MBF0535556.1 NAD(P)/FAD-dependent oxidoreductase [Nitrospirota bacterium]MBF0617417.1 NAD(P)/FAD-dependent oxidoreductase [Nitrospirota bacterium]
MAIKIVILGGGTGGTVVANLLARSLRDKIKVGQVTINMITDKPYHIYQPGLLYVTFDRMLPEDIVRDQRTLVDPIVDVLIDPVVNIDRDNKKVVTETGRNINYDYLVIATGSRTVPELIPGLAEGGHTFYTMDEAKRLRNTLAGFNGGKVVISVGVPHKCPVAPLEMTFLLYDYFSQKGILNKSEIFYTYPINRVHALEPVSNWAVQEFERKGIKYETLFNMERIDADKKIVHSMEGTEVGYDLLIAVPPHKGSQVIETSGIGKDGWVPTDKIYLNNDNHEDVFVVGDTTNIPISKAGSTAHFESEVVAEIITSKITTGVSLRQYDGKVLCFVESGFDAASYIWFNYTTPPKPTTPSKMLHWMKLTYNKLYWSTVKGIL